VVAQGLPKMQTIEKNFLSIKPKNNFLKKSYLSPLKRNVRKRGFLEIQMPVPAGFVTGFNPTRF